MQSKPVLTCDFCYEEIVKNSLPENEMGLVACLSCVEFNHAACGIDCWQEDGGFGSDKEEEE